MKHSSTAPDEPVKHARSALSSRVFRLYFGASCFSTFATWISRFLLGWSAWDLTHSALWVGIISAAMLLPTFLFSPIFGVLSDRMSARNGMLATTALQASIAAGAAFAAWQGSFSIVWLLVLASCIGAVSSAHHPMRLALIPKLVERSLLASAIGISAVVFNSSRVVAPAIAAWLVANASVAVAFAIASGLFICGLLFLLSIHPTARPSAEKHQSVLHDLKNGLRFIASSPPIRLVLLLTMVNGLLGRSIIELLPAISGQLISGDAGSLAILTAFAGIGSIIGGAIISRQRSHERRMIDLVLLCLLAGAGALLPLPLVTSLPGLTAVVLVVSMAMTMVGTGCQALIQLGVEDAYRGRVLSIWTVVTMGVPAFGAFAMGAAADLIGFKPVLLVFAGASIVWTLVLSRQRKIVDTHAENGHEEQREYR